MAVVAKKAENQKEKKYSHLKNLYKKQELISEKKPATLDEIDIKKLVKEKEITRQDLLKDLAIMFAIVAIAFSGYLFSRFV